jgi:hypothetical protein
VSTSARLTMFFESIVDALKQIQTNRSTSLAEEARKLCQAILFKVLIKVGYRNPGTNFTNVLASLSKDADTKAIEEAVMPIVTKVSQVKKIEGQRRD